jgi:hypothetical protein
VNGLVLDGRHHRLEGLPSIPTTGMAIRKDPTTDSPPLGCLPQGTIVVISELRIDGWAKLHESMAATLRDLPGYVEGWDIKKQGWVPLALGGVRYYKIEGDNEEPVAEESPAHGGEGSIPTVFRMPGTAADAPPAPMSPRSVKLTEADVTTVRVVTRDAERGLVKISWCGETCWLTEEQSLALMSVLVDEDLTIGGDGGGRAEEKGAPPEPDLAQTNPKAPPRGLVECLRKLRENPEKTQTFDQLSALLPKTHLPSAGILSSNNLLLFQDTAVRRPSRRAHTRGTVYQY